MKKIIAILMVLLMCTAILAGCGDEVVYEGTTTKTQSEKSEETQMTYETKPTEALLDINDIKTVEDPVVDEDTDTTKPADPDDYEEDDSEDVDDSEDYEPDDSDEVDEDDEMSDEDGSIDDFIGEDTDFETDIEENPHTSITINVGYVLAFAFGTYAFFPRKKKKN